jgi:hypothetical protein
LTEKSENIIYRDWIGYVGSKARNPNKRLILGI